MALGVVFWHIYQQTSATWLTLSPISWLFCFCSLAAAAAITDVLECVVSLNNTGNVRLANISLGGDAVNCMHQDLLSPNTSFTCIVHKQMTADNLANNGTVQLSFPLTNVTPRGSSSLLDTLPASTLDVGLSAVPVFILPEPSPMPSPVPAPVMLVAAVELALEADSCKAPASAGKTLMTALRAAGKRKLLLAKPPAVPRMLPSDSTINTENWDLNLFMRGRCP
jgi:hypothetical protein